MDKPSLTKEEEVEALKIAEAARRAEERAEKKAVERLLEKKRLQRELELRAEEEKRLQRLEMLSKIKATSDSANNENKVVFVSRKRRTQMAEERKTMKVKKDGAEKKGKIVFNAPSKKSTNMTRQKRTECHLTEAQLAAVKRSYLGSSAITEAELQQQQQSKKKKRNKFTKKMALKFEWDDSEDTSRDVDPIYDYVSSKKVRPGLLLQKAKQKQSRSLKQNGGRNQSISDRLFRSLDTVTTVASVTTKPLHLMTQRDWRIFRENFDIIVKGGKAPPPLRTFRDENMAELRQQKKDKNTSNTRKKQTLIHPLLLDAIERTMRYKHPSPIQRQAIPIGLQRRDLIGIAETGSGKTAAFGIPLCHQIFQLPQHIWDTVEDEGPLALVMAPTRELALQIDVEFSKLLSHQPDIKTLAVVGGQEIQAQAYKLRQGIHIIVGTPGRINDCVEMSYLVLNQCSYIVLDEADRMIDLGFAPQIEQILDAMGGLLKSEDEKVAYEQEKEDLDALQDKRLPTYRLTAMFSATMPAEVERIAKKYLRHPAVVSIGDRDSRKNTRIVQKVLFLSSPGQKVKALTEILHRHPRNNMNEKIIVFVNEKKHADGVGRMVENAGRRCVVLHGGKAQDQREENLEAFRRGGVVLVATDVAGRGLDIPDVSHVINFDLPSRSIDAYSHRIGRTGRAGKDGYATSFITDEDNGIMPALVQYLESTNNEIPDRLKRHPAVLAGGTSMNINF